MQYKVFSAQGCGSCHKVKAALKGKGHEVEEHDSEWHSYPHDENWRDRPVDFAEHMAQLSKQGLDLPVVYNVTEKRWIDLEEVLDDE